MMRHGATETAKYYTFVQNLQGDILGLLDRNQDLVVEYRYDPWGVVLATICEPEYEELAQLNPFRYRGYLYDDETGLYYLRTRYYHPEWGRFTQADSELDAGGTFRHDMFVYCGNDPIGFVDPDGEKMQVPYENQRGMFMTTLKELTNLPLLYGGPKNAYILIAQGPPLPGKANGDSLVTELIESNKRVRLYAFNEQNARTSERSQSVIDILFNPSINHDVYAHDDEKNCTIIVEAPSAIVLGHELIHAYAIVNDCDRVRKRIPLEFMMPQGYLRRSLVLQPEAATLGIAGDLNYSITEKMLWNESGVPWWRNWYEPPRK